MRIRQTLLKTRAALRFRRVTASVLKIILFERLSRLLAHRRPGALPLVRPQGIVMRVTERCFLRCRMCGQNREQGRLAGVSARERQRIDPAVLASMVEEIRGWRLKPFIKLTGGEPLIEWRTLRPHVAALREMGCVIKLNTNAVLLKDRELARDVVRTGVDYLSVSIDGTRDVHNGVRGLATAFDNSRRGVRNVIEERAAQRAVYPMVLLSSVVSTINEHDVVNMSQVAGDWGVDWLNIQFLNFLTPERSRAAGETAERLFGTTETPWEGFVIPELTKVDARKLARTIETIRRTAPCPVSVMKVGDTPRALETFHFTDRDMTGHVCHMPFVTMFVVPQAHPVFCIDYPFYPYGDLRHESLDEAWFGERAGEFRRRLIEHHRAHGVNFPQCLRCNWPFNT